MPNQTDQRAPIDEQPIALALAEEAGTLPETDRRADETAPFDIMQHLADGFVFAKSGVEWAATTPSGEIGHGPSPEDAMLNIGAQIVPRPDGKRVLHRRDGTELLLDVADVEAN